ncbi:MAG: MraY family glycosyltransferase [Candidatus Cloacimonetes bacterium]|jgi:UDP-GlcNAc:undecaprenyl-phosphate GlcNAc-1-phosphate transferase|nr:undecaprenyl/decaprenyl-phosphate alpha-N-acetylglucosaminyl 1-phosphate transferase [Candidatus Cloacimonadota bacterium]MDY0337163.1 MraY family glycosyltransferase [Candidatus Cloacimonadaceae bacterium]MCK9333683.1 undecaprenyl/decaprenyl-phosphate alpha-N-acetylglucosaminyl 1-phosphate transferase [Candidatus Cloacimonadota bacterium]MDD2543551.1 MraY family glycosyltransferase [Candidatus Cloacimonadota bacterium]MDD2682526.1 MraY family glycosyltransferase [Candidatus Cloacimonadota b
MTTLITLAALFIFLITQLLVPFNIRFSILHGIIARPNERRIHKVNTPEAGGLSFAIPIIAMQLLLALFTRGEEISRLFFELSVVSTVALTFGLLDDRFESPARYKFIWQIVLGIVMYVIGYRVLFITNPLGEHFILGWLSFPITVLWYVVVINAINLIDGMDGLATGISAIACMVLLTVGIIENNLLVICLSSFMVAGLLAFLRFNFFPAKIFLGETGAQYIALNIAAISTAGASQFKGITSMTLIIPLAALAIPFLDVSLAIFRRIRVGNIFKADKAHIHHTMLAFGLSQRTISIIVYFITFLFGLIAIGFSFTDKKILFSLLMLLLVVVVITAYILMRMEQKK